MPHRAPPGSMPLGFPYSFSASGLNFSRPKPAQCQRLGGSGPRRHVSRMDRPRRRRLNTVPAQFSGGAVTKVMVQRDVVQAGGRDGDGHIDWPDRNNAAASNSASTAGFCVKIIPSEIPPELASLGPPPPLSTAIRYFLYSYKRRQNGGYSPETRLNFLKRPETGITTPPRFTWKGLPTPA
jgi:hypothetical protein